MKSEPKNFPIFKKVLESPRLPGTAFHIISSNEDYHHFLFWWRQYLLFRHKYKYENIFIKIKENLYALEQ